MRRLSRGNDFLKGPVEDDNDSDAEVSYPRNDSVNGRRRSIGGNRRRSSFGSGLSASKSPQKTLAEQARIADMYKTVIQLASENKINEKNSWNLDLIDHMGKLIREDGRSVNFQKASCTLDASVKIYSHRVDDTHQSSHRILESLSRNGGGAVDGDDDGDDDDEDNGSGGKRTKVGSKSKRLNIAETIERSVENINNQAIECNQSADPFFQKMSKAFDEGGARGMLMNNMRLVDGTCSLTFFLPKNDEESSEEEKEAKDTAVGEESQREETNEKSEKMATSEDEIAIPLSADIDISDLIFNSGIALSDLVSTSVCPQLDIYRTQASVPDSSVGITKCHFDGTVSSQSMAATDYPSESPAVTYESDGEVDDYCQYEAYDNYDAGDDGDVDARSVHGDGDGDESESPQAAVAHQSKIQWNAVFSGSESSPSSTLRSSGGGSDQLDALWEGGTAADEYAYFDFSVLNKTNAWAGARHWKLAMRTRSQARDVSKIEDAADTADGGPGVGEDVAGEEEAVVEGAKKKGKKSTTKEKFLIDFFGPEIDAAQLAAPSSSAKADSTQLTATALQKAFSAAKQGINDLPPDAKLQARDLCRLFLSPKIVVPPPKLQYAVASAPAPASSSSSLSAALGQGDEDRIWGEVGTGGGSAPIADCPDGAACDDVVDYVYEDDGDDGDDGYFGGYDDMQGGDENAPSADPVESVRQKMQKGLHIDMDKMVKAGRTVQKIHIGYAKKTTRVNVRKLKTDIWGHIDRTTTDSSLSNSDENIISGVEDEESAVVEKSVAKRGDLEGPLSFQELIADVGAEQQQENVSLPFYFICLLHLANEKTLSINGNTNMDDLSISRG